MEDEVGDEIDEEPLAASRPQLGVVVGVTAMIVGLLLIAIAVAAPDQTTYVAGGSTTTAPTSGATIADLAQGTVAPTTPAGLGVGVGPLHLGRRALRGFGEVQVTITSGDGKTCQACLLSAVSIAQRERGLMEVTDPALGGYDGMLFEYPGEIAGAFWMRNTPMPLSIAYFDHSGKLVSTTDMAPCADSPDCPSYPANGRFQYAIEVPQGQLAEVDITGEATIRIDARRCALTQTTG